MSLNEDENVNELDSLSQLKITNGLNTGKRNDFLGLKLK